jgi:nitrogen regulatory protein PII
MKKIEAVVRHHKLEDIKNAVTEAGVGQIIALGNRTA